MSIQQNAIHLKGNSLILTNEDAAIKFHVKEERDAYLHILAFFFFFFLRASQKVWYHAFMALMYTFIVK